MYFVTFKLSHFPLLRAPAGLALLIAQGSAPKPQGGAREPAHCSSGQESDKNESLGDLDSGSGSGGENSDHETNL